MTLDYAHGNLHDISFGPVGCCSSFGKFLGLAYDSGNTQKSVTKGARRPKPAENRNSQNRLPKIGNSVVQNRTVRVYTSKRKYRNAMSRSQKHRNKYSITESRILYKRHVSRVLLQLDA